MIALLRLSNYTKLNRPSPAAIVNQTTPLVGAVQSCSVEAVDALIKAGSDLSAKSAGGMTALQLAHVFQREDVAALLRTAGAK